ncbi:type-2Aa cytolytic delta-endotoxin [Dickeya ananatis]|uniref:type-2Aa cytolytic delta-endotoxin n=1 Tax=Dickeya ananatis TaxID=3061286 RepID=UPI00388FCAAA
MNNITLNPTTAVDEKNNFSVTLNTDLKYVSQAINMATIFNEAYIPQEGISFEKALSIAKSHDTLAVVGTHTVKGNSNVSQVWVAIDQLQNLIRMVQGAATENWMAFGIAAKAFIDLNAQKNGNYFTIFSEQSNTLSYQYNMFDVTQNADTGSVYGWPVNQRRHYHYQSQCECSGVSRRLINHTKNELQEYGDC